MALVLPVASEVLPTAARESPRCYASNGLRFLWTGAKEDLE